MAEFRSIEEMGKQVADKAMNYIDCNGKTLGEWIEILKDYHEHKWIPCSERLPEENQVVIACNKKGWVTIEIYSKGTKKTWDSGWYVAWMEKPEPYREEQKQ